MASFNEKRHNISLWFERWLKSQLSMMYDEMEYGIKGKGQILSMKHIIQKHLNKDDEYLKGRITKGSFSDRVDIATCFLSTKESIYKILETELLNPENLSDIMDWICDDSEENELYWILNCSNPLDCKGFMWNKEIRDVQEIPKTEMTSIDIILKKMKGMNNVFFVESMYPIF